MPMAQFYAVEMTDGRRLLMEVTIEPTPAGPLTRGIWRATLQ